MYTTSIRSSHAGLAWTRSACIRLRRGTSGSLGLSVRTASKSMSLTSASKSPVANDPNRYRPTRDGPVTVTIASRIEANMEPTPGAAVNGLQPFMDKSYEPEAAGSAHGAVGAVHLRSVRLPPAKFAVGTF